VARFEVLAPAVEEELPPYGDPVHVAHRFAERKARWVSRLRPRALVIAGDTVVALPDAQAPAPFRLLGKPVTPQDAAQMLRTLSARTHVVVTGVSLRWPGGRESFSETSRVTFRLLSEAQIRAYVATGEPFDKAGGYGLQDAGRELVAHIEGSESNVVGLPVEALSERLMALFDKDGP
jgi:septum formation protein